MIAKPSSTVPKCQSPFGNHLRHVLNSGVRSGMWPSRNSLLWMKREKPASYLSAAALIMNIQRERQVGREMQDICRFLPSKGPRAAVVPSSYAHACKVAAERLQVLECAIELAQHSIWN
ncbi:hypothetical protein KC366_g63 [Hortaea werneckii]|nr:hypothetical protein KC366_g63 [Hortaea werneckii]